LAAGETAKQRSITLRSTLNDIYVNSIKDLCDQATRVDIALAENVQLTQDCLQQLEKELLRVRHNTSHFNEHNTKHAKDRVKHSEQDIFIFSAYMNWQKQKS